MKSIFHTIEVNKDIVDSPVRVVLILYCLTFLISFNSLFEQFFIVEWGLLTIICFFLLSVLPILVLDVSFVFLAAIFVIKLTYLPDIYEPFVLPDSVKYLREYDRFHDNLGFEKKSDSSLISYIVESTSYIYMLVTKAFYPMGSKFMLGASYTLYFYAIYFFSLLLGKNFKLRFVFSILLALSPLVSQFSTWILKEVPYLFLLSLQLLFITKYIRNKGSVCLVLLVLFSLIGTLVRPYNILLLSCYIIVLSNVSYRVVFIFMTLLFGCLLTKLGVGNVVMLIKNSILSTAALFFAPNFLRVSNWQNIPFLTLESIVLFFGLVSFFLVSSDNEMKKRLVCAFIIFGLILGYVSSSRTLLAFDLDSIRLGSLINEDVSRKIIPLYPMLISVGVIGYFNLMKKYLLIKRVV
ncbi:hypothetical protein [Vibrio owensii]|uniref:hypothetical protein n=1 Tax=Vibrio owensii TaxID=696485 RepID=UPI0009975BFC|nr:hypothetical protein [Vibrio owensii]AQW57892.1 hypothetical protein A9237_07070 [Vibrio owensii]